MSPDSSSSEVDPRPHTNLNHAPIQMIQVPECTQSHGGPLKLQQQLQQPQQPQQQQQQQHVIHVDYAKKLTEGIAKMANSHHQQQQPSVFHQKPALMQPHKTDEELNLGTREKKNVTKKFLSLSRSHVRAAVDLETRKITTSVCWCERVVCSCECDTRHAAWLCW
jgi:hypothetical protein